MIRTTLTPPQRQVLAAVARRQGWCGQPVPLEAIITELRERTTFDPKRAFVTFTLAALVRAGNLSAHGDGWRLERLT